MLEGDDWKRLISNLTKYKFLLPQNIMSMFVVPFSYTFDVFHCFTYFFPFSILLRMLKRNARITEKNTFFMTLPVSLLKSYAPLLLVSHFHHSHRIYVIEILIHSESSSNMFSSRRDSHLSCNDVDNKNEKHRQWQRHWHLFTPKACLERRKRKTRKIIRCHAVRAAREGKTRVKDKQKKNKSNFNINLKLSRIMQ